MLKRLAAPADVAHKGASHGPSFTTAPKFPTRLVVDCVWDKNPAELPAGFSRKGLP
jgi:hypothetical protein